MGKRTYISIPITGHDIEKQKQKAEQVKRKIPDSVSPFDINKDLIEQGETRYGVFMGKDIEYLLDYCDTVFFCKGWENSKGCKLEMCAAEIYGLKILFEK